MKDVSNSTLAFSAGYLLVVGAFFGTFLPHKDSGCMAIYQTLKDQSRAVDNCDSARGCMITVPDLAAVDKTWHELKDKCPIIAPSGPTVMLHPAAESETPGLGS